VLLAEVVRTSEAVASTPARLAKVTSLADLLRRLAPDEVEPAVAFLVGRPRQGKVGIGWATLRAVDPPPAEDPSIEILELDRAVTELQALEGQGSGALRLGLLGDLMARATAPEADFIRRVLLGELRQGAVQGVMADAVARATGIPIATVRRAAMLAGDLARVATVALTEGEPGLSAIGLDVLRPVLPMLASTSPDVASALSELGPSLVEWKLDGARIQAHRKGDEVRLYTRNLNDVTERLPAVVNLVRSLDVDWVVLDGEILGVSDDGPEAFQETMSSFGRRTGAPGRASLGVWFFDCLHLDGEDFLDRPLVERATALDRTGAPRVPSRTTDDLDAAVAFQTEALAAGHEGVMVKAVGSPYEAGRRGAAWRKVKPVHTFDLVVLAAEWGAAAARAGCPTSTWAPGIPTAASSWWARRSRASPTPSSSGRRPSSWPASPAARTRTSSRSTRPWWSRSPSTGSSRPPATRGEWPCGSPASAGTATTRTRPTPTPSTRSARCSGGGATPPSSRRSATAVRRNPDPGQDDGGAGQPRRRSDRPLHVPTRLALV